MDALVRKGSVHDANEEYVRKLRVPDNATDQQIQEALQRIFRNDQVQDELAKTQSGTVLKKTTMTATQNQNYLFQFDQSNQFSQSSVDDENQVQDSESVAENSETKTKLAIYSSKIHLDKSVQDRFYELLKTESPYKEILEEIENGKNEVERGEYKYRKKKGMLVVHRTGQDEGLNFWRIIVPDNVESRNLIVKELHSVPYSIHPGINRTVNKVRKSFFWKGLTGHVREYVESCPTCQVEKADHTLSKGKLQSTQIPEEKWQEVSIDFITDLPKTAGGKDCIFVAVDKATRMVKLAPCSKTIAAFKMAKLFWQTVVKNYGIPRVIYSDRGAQFVGRVWRELWSLTGTQLRYSTSYHPQTQGVVERMNSVIGQTLRCLISEEKDRDWLKLLDTIEFVINSSPNVSTGYTPFFLNYGFNPVTPMDLLKGDETSNVESVSSFVERMRSVWAKAKKNLEKSVQAQSKYYDKRHKDIAFKVGDMVLLLTRNLAVKNTPAKLQKRFVGPFEVMERIGTQAYKLKLPDHFKVHNVFHVSLLKGWKTATYREEPTTEEIELEEADKAYEVEKILRWRHANHGKEYLVLWEGYPMEEASWIPERNFTYQDQLQEDLERDQPQEEK